MQNRLRRERTGSSHPFQNVRRSLSTSQGRFTFYAIILCAILGIVVYQPAILLVQKLNPTVSPQDAAENAMLITVGLCIVVLVGSLLKMDRIMTFMGNRRLESFNQRMEKRKESDNSDG